MSEKFHIAYITDDNYAMPTAVSIVSLLENKAANISYVVHLILDNVSDQNKDRFKEISYPNCEIDIIDADSSAYQEFQKNKVNLHVSKSALLKFNLPEIFSDIDTLLYIDGDTLIIQDISELFKIDLSKYYAGVVDNFEALMFSTLSRYFNNGVMLLNLKKMRADNMTTKLIDYRKNGLNYFMDQDAFNIVFNEEVLFLSSKYNFRVPKFLETDFEEFNEEFCDNKYIDENECLMDQKILHAVRQLKPWKYNLPWVTDIFFKYLKLSPYKTQKLRLKSPMPFVIKRTENQIKRDLNKREWRFPREKIAKGSKIILYSAGEVGQTFWNWNKDIGYSEIIMWIDKKYNKINEKLNSRGALICPPDEIKNLDHYDYVLIASVRLSVIASVSKFLIDAGVPEEKIITLF